MQSALHTKLSGVLVKSLFKAGAGVRALTERARGSSYVVAGKLCRFEHNGLRGILDLGVKTAHNTCKRNGSVTVADNQVCGSKLEFLFVKRRDLLALRRTANDDLRVLKICHIKSVHRLTEFLENVVGNIHHVGDRVYSDKRQTAAHPRGRLTYLNVGNVVSDIAGAKIGSLNGHVEIKICTVLDVVKGGHLELLAQNCRNLAGDTDNALAVGTVCGNSNVKNVVIKTENGLYVGAQGCVCGKHKQTVVACAGVHILGNTDLNARAKHTLGINSAELALFNGHNALNGHVVLCRRINGRAHESHGESAANANVVRAAADLEGATLAAVNGADVNVCVGDKLAGLDLTYYHARNIFSYFNKLLNLEANGEQKSLQLLGGNVNVYVFTKPTKRC